MKITISPLQQRIATFVVEAEPSETIGELKLKISAKQGHPVESQRIFKSGKSLQDDKTIESYDIKDASQLTLILKGAAASSVSSSGVSGPRTAPTLSDVPRPPASGSTPAPPLAPTPARPIPPESGSTFSRSGMSSNVGASQTNIDEIMNMGMDFTEEQVIHALRASLDNPDQAVDLLLNGYSERGVAFSALQASNVPEQSSNAMGLPHATASGPNFSQNMLQSMLQPQLGALNGAGGTGSPGHGDSAVPIGVDSAQVQEIRRMVAENPALTGPLIESIKETDPEEAAHLSTRDVDSILDFFSKMGAKW